MAALSNRGGVSRRRVIQGAAWSAPVIVLATSVPAAAVSLEQGHGIVFAHFQPQWTQWFWASSAPAQNITAVTVAVNFQNMPGPAGADPGHIHTLVYTVVIPVGNVGTDPGKPLRWGLGSNNDGIAPGLGFTLIGQPTVAYPNVTLTFQWTGVMPLHDGMYVMVWAQSDDTGPGQLAAGTVSATHDGDNTSAHSASGNTALITDVAEWMYYFRAGYDSDYDPSTGELYSPEHPEPDPREP